MIAAMGRQLKQSVNVFHNLMLYLRLPRSVMSHHSENAAWQSVRIRISRTLIVEAINPINAGTLVVSAQDEEILGIFDLVGKQEADGFK